jgi:hypothetical protein
MRALLTLIVAVLMIGSLANGAAVHALELSSAGEVTETTLWLHSAGDHDEVPADADRNYPHHHNQCQGHDVAAPLKACPVPTRIRAGITQPSVATAALVAGPPARLLRPPIA